MIFTVDAMTYGIDLLEPGIYAAVCGVNDTKYEEIIRTEKGWNNNVNVRTALGISNRTKLFFAFEKEIYVASTYKGYPVVALAYEALEGSNSGGDGMRAPYTNNGESNNSKYRSQTKKIVLPDSIVILDDYCLNSHNYLE
jgi:hypothetical protein